MSPNSSLIDKRTHPLARTFVRVRDGDEKGLFLEGKKLLAEAVEAKVKIRKVIARSALKRETQALLTKAGQAHVPVHEASDAVVDFISDTETPQGVMAVADSPAETSLPTDAGWKADLIVLALGIQHPQNMGNILRTSEAAGVQEVWTIKGTVNPHSPKVIRGSAGSVFRVPVRVGLSWTDSVAYLKERGIACVGADQNGHMDYDAFNWASPTALCLGAEGPGFSADQLRDLTSSLKIPMKGRVESLNVGTAAAVCLFEAVRQRKKRS